MDALTTNKQYVLLAIKDALMSKKIVITDSFNVFKLSEKDVGDNLANVQVITYSDIDSFIFSKWFNVVNDSISNKGSNILSVYVNPPSVPVNTACIYTTAMVGVTSNTLQDSRYYTKFQFPLKMLIVVDNNKNKNIRRLRTSDFYIKTSSDLFNVQKMIENEIFGKNSDITKEDSFKLLLQLLALGNITITNTLYMYISEPYETYTQFRRLNVKLDLENGENITSNPYKVNTIDTVKSCQYSRYGMPLNRLN